MENSLRKDIQNTSASVLMINSQGMMLNVDGQDYFVTYRSNLFIIFAIQ